jgi:hypothetical protein
MKAIAAERVQNQITYPTPDERKGAYDVSGEDDHEVQRAILREGTQDAWHPNSRPAYYTLPHSGIDRNGKCYNI